jgi:hypothetical protein
VGGLVAEEMGRETALGRDVSRGVRPDPLRKRLRPRRRDGLAHAGDAEFGLELRLAIGGILEQEVLREVHPEPIDRVLPERDIAERPHLADRNGIRSRLDRLDDRPEPIDGLGAAVAHRAR